jgi:branched-subunit amino acid transport protein
MNPWIVLIGAGLGTYALRSAVLLVFHGAQPPEKLVRSSTFVGPAVMVALATQTLRTNAETASIGTEVLWIAAALAAVSVAAWRGTLGPGVIAGLAVFLAIPFVIGVGV